MRRRLSFAMPFVLVTSCSQGSPPASLPVDPPPGMEVASAPPIPRDDGAEPLGDPPEVPPPDRPPPVDAGTPIDAPPAAQPGQVVLWLSGRVIQPKGYISCHDFGPRSRGCNPPPPVREPPMRLTERMLNLQAGPNNSTVMVISWHELGAPIRHVRVRAAKRATAKFVRTQRHQAVVEVSLDLATVRQGLELEIDIDDP